MALRRSSRSTTIAATQKSAIDAAARHRTRDNRQASRARATPQPSSVQPAQPTQPVGLLPEVQAVAGGKRRRDGDDSQTGSRKRRQPEASLFPAAATVLRRADQASRADKDHFAPEQNLAIEQGRALQADPLQEADRTDATLGITEGQKLLNALFALVSKNRLLLQKEERHKESSSSFTRRLEAAARVKQS